jgi:hypothetical protein
MALAFCLSQFQPPSVILTAGCLEDRLGALFPLSPVNPRDHSFLDVLPKSTLLLLASCAGPQWQNLRSAWIQ